MVSHAGKDFLRNCINNAKFHNRILEENEMWKQWEIEQGLTMMVSDDAIRSRNKHTCKYHEKKKRERIEKKKHILRGKKDLIVTAPQNKESERWDHSGFAELYPEESVQNSGTDSRQERRSSPEFDTDTLSSESSSDDKEILEDFKEYKRKSRLKHKRLSHKIHLESMHNKSRKKHKKHSRSTERNDKKKRRKDKHK